MSQSDILTSRPERVDRARRLIREAAEMLSMQVNDEQTIGGVLNGIKSAENHCRQALADLTGLDTNRDGGNRE